MADPMMTYFLIATLLFVGRVVTTLPTIVLIYAFYQRHRHHVPLNYWFLFWGIVCVALNIMLQWFPGPTWLHVTLSAFWTTSVIMAVFAGLKNIEEVSMAAALAAVSKQGKEPQPQEESEAAAALYAKMRARISALVASNLAAVRGEEIGGNTVPMEIVEEGSDER